MLPHVGLANVHGYHAVWRDPEDPSRIKPDFDFGDHMHSNDAGYSALANSIDLTLFD